MNGTNQNGMGAFNFNSNEPKKEPEVIGATPTIVPDNFNTQKYIFNPEPEVITAEPTPVVSVPTDATTQALYQAATTGKDFNEQALMVLQNKIVQIKNAPVSARYDLYEELNQWFEDTYVDEESDEGYKIIDYPTYIEMLKIMVDAGKYVEQ